MKKRFNKFLILSLSFSEPLITDGCGVSEYNSAQWLNKVAYVCIFNASDTY